MGEDEAIVQKNITLFFEFQQYVLEHPEIIEDVADDAEIVLLPKDDLELYRANLEAARRPRQNDDVPNRPVVYIEIDGLAPIRSRIINPRVRTIPPAWESVTA
jgi:hypothetical protein